MICAASRDFGPPVIGVTTLKMRQEALEIANQTQFSSGAGRLDPRQQSGNRMGGLAGRVWTNCYHCLPAHAAFSGYKQSGVGRETHKWPLMPITDENLLW